MARQAEVASGDRMAVASRTARLAAWLAVFVSACGHDGPTGPSAPGPPVSTLRFRSIGTTGPNLGGPVAGAEVTSGGGVAVGVTDASGAVTGAITNPNHLVVTEPGLILARNFSTSDAESGVFSVVFFDPSIQFDETLVANLNYNAYESAGRPSRLYKAPGDLWIHLGAGVSGAAFGAAAAHATSVNREAGVYLDHGSVHVDAVIDPDDPCFADPTSDACSYLNGKIVCRTSEICSRVALMTHEIMHILGWCHDAPGTRSIMSHIVSVRVPTAADVANGFYRIHRQELNSYAQGSGERSPGVSGAAFQESPGVSSCSGGY